MQGERIGSGADEVADIPFLIKAIADAMKSRGDRELAEVGLTFSQMRVIRVIAQASTRGPVSPSDIEAALGVSQPTVAGLVKRLQQKGFVRVSVDAQDRRYKVVELTQKGAELAKSAVTHAAEHKDAGLEGFTEQEKETLRMLLTRLMANVTSAGE